MNKQQPNQKPKKKHNSVYANNRWKYVEWSDLIENISDKVIQNWSESPLFRFEILQWNS